MYDWLSAAIADNGTVVTANRRLARVLSDAYAAEQLNAGSKAWRSPDICAWPDWLMSLSNGAINQDTLPTRINSYQSQILWERCLRQQIGESASGISTLVRLSRDAWQRLADWQVTIKDVARAAQSDDQKAFASVAGRYLGILEREQMVDDAGLGKLILGLISSQQLQLPARVTFAGFERDRPVILAIRDALIDAGIQADFALRRQSADQCSLRTFENSAAEFRCAGRWAREQIEANPDARIAIVANDLDKAAESITRQVRDGATPGWQHGHRSLFDAVNVSYGRKLSEYPAIATGLLLLKWLVGTLSSTDVGLLLRSPLLGTGAVDGRARQDLRLRQLPDRLWSPSMVTAELRGGDDNEDQNDWLMRLAAFSKRRRELPKTASPAEWAVLVDEVLKSFGWPGQVALDSTEFQLINRWRELLNEFARLGLVSASMGSRAAIARLDMMASEVIFQPESTAALLQLMGPLEASGIRFDALWISGVTTANWPPPGRPSALVSRRLQEKHGMPDSTPSDTLYHAEQLLTGLVASSTTVVCSHALTVDDAEQSVSDLLSPLLASTDSSSVDTGWYAATLSDLSELDTVEDSVPVITAEEKISGGAGTIQRQLNDPITAFVHGRMGARVIYPQAVGIPASIRGNLIHDALYKLYIDLPSNTTIQGWDGKELNDRIDEAMDFAFARHERNADAVLKQLLNLERSRVSELVRQFVAIDGNRGEFQVAGVEGIFEFVEGHIRMPLRFDRIDRIGETGIAILDYKTGTKKQLLNRDNEAKEIQLFVYACATEAPVSALALVNIDSREIVFDGAGHGYTDTAEWSDLLAQVKERIRLACNAMSGGDVRINLEQGVSTARPLNLLTRYTELRRNDG